MSFAHTSEIGL